MGTRIDAMLLTFRVASFLGIWGVGTLVDRHLRVLILASFLLFAISATGFGIWPDAPAAIYASTTIWGLSFGGSATLFQTASATAAGESADVARSMIVTVWNIGIAGGGIVGGLVLDYCGVTILPWALAFMLVVGFAVALR